ncbi:protein NEOXANTHIN-DEFICIENT 1 isoform X2 [Magnolia sinica]|uniref:protein NEOXANTHIN-DEFICIENT 1 isoform X2 n=1 Tax=Magnolia sinica TaxID=86752 RepID=UPI002659049B|nr:protein NEOXANTHIN-DEFICIENT 1 isoform X2 [Magnolia sinica]
MSIEVAESQSCPGYVDGPPWLFKGSALYQLHLVKADIARSFIPKDLRLVEAFGYTLGGFFLARYDDSPAGMFDELVVIAGIVWNPPTSCAWAARVLVNSHKACRHGRKHVGLPSHVARFSKRVMATSENPKSKWNGFLNMIGISSTCSSPKGCMDIQVTEITGSSATALCDINLPTDALESKSDKKWLGPAIRMSLPSFSGRTVHNPHLLKYSCQIECRVRAVEPAKISGPTTALQSDEGRSFDEPSFNSNDDLRDVFAENDSLNRSISVLLSKPIFALEFNSLKMQVDAPTIVSQRSDNVVSDS